MNDSRMMRVRGFGVGPGGTVNLGIATPLFFPADTSDIQHNRSNMMKVESGGSIGGPGGGNYSIGGAGSYGVPIGAGSSTHGRGRADSHPILVGGGTIEGTGSQDGGGAGKTYIMHQSDVSGGDGYLNMTKQLIHAL